MATTTDPLDRPLADGTLRLERLTEAHRAELAIACAEDAAIWAIYPVDWSPANFDAAFAALLVNPARIPFAILVDDRLIGMTSYIALDRVRQIVEIGNTYLRPAARGTGLNDRIKRLLIANAFAHGIRRVELRVDERNARSKAAIVKIGGVLEGVMRQERITWTGHVRDTALFAILADEWTAG